MTIFKKRFVSFVSSYIEDSSRCVFVFVRWPSAPGIPSLMEVVSGGGPSSVIVNIKGIIEYGHEAKPSRLGLQIVFWPLVRIMVIMIIMVRARNYDYNYNSECQR